jgi:hypothetical protein
VKIKIMQLQMEMGGVLVYVNRLGDGTIEVTGSFQVLNAKQRAEAQAAFQRANLAVAQPAKKPRSKR